MYSARDSNDIDRFFRGLTEHAFLASLGVIDPPLIDYVAMLLVRFMRPEQICSEQAAGLFKIDELARMLAMVQQAPLAVDVVRDSYRHIGDYTLFWSGLYPEALKRLQCSAQQEFLIDYRTTGKQAYWIASTLISDAAASERRLLEHLSDEYDLCVEGLAEVRRSWAQAG